MSTVPTPTTALTLDEINPASFDFWLRDDVEGALAKLRHERPVAWHQHPDSGKGFWSITRFDDVAAATRDWDTFSSSYGIQVMTDPEDMQYMGAIRSMISTDPPKHTKLRSVVNRGFTPKMIAKAEGAVRERARRAEAEFVTVADALPVAIICDMMGVPSVGRDARPEPPRWPAATRSSAHARSPGPARPTGELRDYGLWLGQKRLDDIARGRPDDHARARRGRRRGDAAGGPRAVLSSLLIAAGNETHAHRDQPGHVGLHDRSHTRSESGRPTSTG